MTALETILDQIKAQEIGQVAIDFYNGFFRVSASIYTSDPKEGAKWVASWKRTVEEACADVLAQIKARANIQEGEWDEDAKEAFEREQQEELF